MKQHRGSCHRSARSSRCFESGTELKSGYNEKKHKCSSGNSPDKIQLCDSKKSGMVEVNKNENLKITLQKL